MSKKGNILVVDDNKAIRSTLELMLPAHFEKVTSIPSPNLLTDTLKNHPDIDVILLDMNFHAGVNTGNEGLYWLKEIKKMKPNISVVLFTAYADIPLAVNAIREGAMDFIEKPWNNDKLIITLQNGVNLARNAEKIKNLKSIKEGKGQMFWGESDVMLNLKRLVEKVAPTDANILIIGENGTGKEILAKEIHALSKRDSEVLINVDMGAITESLFESELFGHAKGAFTDAKSERAGKFEVASGGTLFLDELGNLPLPLQSKLLTVIQSRQVVRVGENTPRSVDIRLVTATNCNLEKMVADGTFREDLFYRINTFVLNLPPLRERGSDIIGLATLFLVRYAKKYGKSCDSFSQKAIDKLLKHSWPGNIRELQHTIERGVIVCEANSIDADDLLINKSSSDSNNMSLQDVTLEEMERGLIENALKNSGGNISEVANKLGVTRQTLYNKLKKYNL